MIKAKQDIHIHVSNMLLMMITHEDVTVVQMSPHTKWGELCVPGKFKFKKLLGSK